MISRIAKMTVKSLLIFLLCNVSSRASAQVDNLVIAPIKVKFLGGDNETLTFSVRYENKSTTSFRLLALNENGEVWFQENYRSTRDFEKKLNIPRLTESEYVIFVLRTANEPEITSKVKITTKVVDDVAEYSR